MSWSLTIAGLSTVRVSANSWQEEETDYRGVFRRVASGDAQSTQRSPKRGFGCTVFFTTTAELKTFKLAISEAGAIGVAAPVTVTSSEDGGTTGDTLTCYCWLGRIQAVRHGDTAYWKGALSLREA